MASWRASRILKLVSPDATSHTQDNLVVKIDNTIVEDQHSTAKENAENVSQIKILITLQTNLVPDYDSDDSSINDNNNLENIETCTEIDQSIQKALPKSSSSSSSTSSSSSSNSTSSGSSSSDSDSSTSSKRTNQHSEQYANDSSDSDDDSVSDSDRKKLSKRGRKRSLNPAKWKQNKVKKLRNTGESYISISKSQKVIPSRCLKVPCTDKCRLKCTTNISMDE
ncbi:hypothetical protein HF086_003525, partial [Spodoptera exigua]